MPKLVKGFALFFVFALVFSFATTANAGDDPEGDWDSIWIEAVPYIPDSLIFQIKGTSDNTGNNKVIGVGIPFTITVSGGALVQVDTTVARTLAGSVMSGWSQKAVGTDSTGGPGGIDPTVSPVKFVIGGVDFTFNGIAADTGFLLGTIKMTTNAPCNVTIDTNHTNTLFGPTFTSALAVDYTPRWVPTPPFIFLEVKDIQKGTTAIPEQFGLVQNYPNPFNATTLIQFALPKTSHVKLEIFNVLGQRVNTLVDEELTAGYKQILWDGTDHRGISVASGIYFYRIKAGNLFTEMKKMVMLK